MKKIFGLAIVLAATLALAPGTANTSKALMGCPFPAGNVYQTDISKAPIDPNSANWLKATIDGGGGGGFQAWMPSQEYLNVATNQTTMVSVKGQNQGHQVFTPFPFQSGFIIQKPGTDQHLAVLNTDTCVEYEAFYTFETPSPLSLSVYSDLQTNLKSKFVQPPVGGNSTATGIPFGLVGIRPEEIAAGHIDHAIEWDGVSGSLSQTQSVSPAGVKQATDGHPYVGPPSDIPIPYGAHARLKQNFNISGLSPTVQIIATAMKKYGLYLVDSGCCNTINILASPKGSVAWTNADALSLLTITPADFDIVPAPK